MPEITHLYTPPRPLDLPGIRKTIWWGPASSYRSTSDDWYMNKFREMDALGYHYEWNFDLDYWRQRTTNAWLEADPQTEAEILQFYREYPDYIPELSVWTYHGDKINQMRQYDDWFFELGVETVLDYGAGVGDIVMFLQRMGYEVTYLDVGGVTAGFFEKRMAVRDLPTDTILVDDPGFTLDQTGKTFDAIITNDVVEHIPDVYGMIDAWHASLNPGGYAVTQWTFNDYADADGEIYTPCHIHTGRERSGQIIEYMRSKFEQIDRTWNRQMRLWRRRQ